MLCAVDPERLAALLDGRLSDELAVAVRTQLAAADASVVSAYADAIAIAEELSGEIPRITGVVEVITIRTPPKRSKWRVAAVLFVLAALAALMAALHSDRV